ncbi:MAG: hypothetical protein ACKVUT_09700 [Gaiella sp.]
MTKNDRRTAEDIRAEIRAERAQLDDRLSELGAGAKRSGRIAGSALAALGGVALLVRRRARRRAS